MSECLTPAERKSNLRFRLRGAPLATRRDVAQSLDPSLAPRCASHAVMEQGGWLDIRSLMGYAHDAPEYRRQIAAEMDDVAGKRRSRAKG